MKDMLHADGPPDVVFDLFAASEQLVAIFDKQDILRYANAAFEQAYHHLPDGHSTWVDIMRANYERQRGSKVDSRDFESWLASAKSRRGKLPFRAFETDLYNGRWIWMAETTLDSGWMLCVGSDVTAIHQDERSLRLAYNQALRTAQTDALTGLSNRTHLMHQLDQLIALGEPFALVLLDLDHFKHINDRHGHLVGDEVIRDFARHLQACTRRGDGCGRVGGEEFMLLLPDCGDRAQAEAIVERLLAKTRAARPLPGTPEQGYSASASLALWQPGESATHLYHRADQALYRAKDAGRDRLVCAD
ncbi:MAG: GGDEF domain-containing protein [Acidovorax sp.]